MSDDTAAAGPGGSDWVRYNNEVNPRDRRMSVAWVARLQQWLLDGRVGPSSHVLDFGCGYFDLGLGLVGRVGRVDGYDLNPGAVAVARGRTAGVQGSLIYAERDAIPPAAYDVIVVNSVLQYFPALAQVEEFLDFAASRLRPDAPALLVLADVIPPRYSKALDGVENLLYAVVNGLAEPMWRHLCRAARLPRGMELLRLPPEALQRAAAARGFAFARLERNLTPSRRRYTCVLERRPVPGRHT